MPSVRPIYLELQRPQWNIYLDNHLHYILLGLVRPHRRHPFTPHHHRRSQHWRLPHIRFHLNSLFPLHFHQQVLSRRHSTLFQRHLRLQRHHHSQQHGLQLPFQFIHHRHHLHHYRVHLTHLASITLSKLRPLHRHPVQLLLDTQQ